MPDDYATVTDLLAVAESRDRVPFYGARPEQIDTVVELQKLIRVIAEHCRSVMMDGIGHWLDIADDLEQHATLCRNTHIVMIETEIVEQLPRD